MAALAATVVIAMRQRVDRIDGVDPKPAVYLLDALRRATRSQIPAYPLQLAASLYAAKDSAEAFQIVLYGGDPGLPAISVSLDAPLTSKNGAQLPMEAVRFYREHYVLIGAPSLHGEGGAKPGVYPDALIPFRNPFTGERLNSAALEAKPRENEAVYVEVIVPPDAAAGSYASTISVVTAGQLFVVFPVTLTVWNFAIPRAPSLHSAFQGYDSDHLLGPARYYGYRESSPQHAALAVAMDEFLLENRIVPESPMDGAFSIDDHGRLAQSSEDDQRLKRLFSRPERSDVNPAFGPETPFQQPLGADRGKAITYLRESYEWFRQRGLLDKVWLRTNDEPHTTRDFQQAAALADLIHEANPNFRVAVTGGFDHAGFERFLFGKLDIFMMCFDTFDPAKTAGAEFWSYTAVVQNTDNPSPYWQIDFPLLNYRVAPWINFRYGLRGLLYWTTDYWSEIQERGHSPWDDPCSLSEDGECYNGDGLLVYPGKDVGYIAPEGAYGSRSAVPVYGPVPSLRLKAVRDGMQDYELLVLAASKDKQAALEAAIAVGCRGDHYSGDAIRNCFHAWTTDPDVLLQTRLQLADIIQKNAF